MAKTSEFMKEKLYKYFALKYESEQAIAMTDLATILFSLLSNEEIENARILSLNKLKEVGVDVS